MLFVSKKKIGGKLFHKNLSGNFSGNFWEFPKNFRQEIFPESFPEKCGKLFRQTSRKETTKNSPGTFPKNGGIFRQNSLWKHVFSP